MTEKNPSPLRSAQHLSPFPNKFGGRGRTGSHPAKAIPKNARVLAKSLRKNETDAEGLLWWELKAKRLHGYKFVRQVPIGHYIVDFVCRKKKFIVEVDGSQHADNARDLIRTSWLNQSGYSVLRFRNHEVLNSRQMVLSMIVEALEDRLEGDQSQNGYWPSASSPPNAVGNGERCRAQRDGEGYQ